MINISNLPCIGKIAGVKMGAGEMEAKVGVGVGSGGTPENKRNNSKFKFNSRNINRFILTRYGRVGSALGNGNGSWS